MSFTRINVQEAHEMISHGAVSIVDIRDPGAFSQGHIRHAQNINDGNIEAFLDKADREKPLICYCYHGFSSQRAADYFVGQGFKAVFSIDGGWEEWRAAYG